MCFTWLAYKTLTKNYKSTYGYWRHQVEEPYIIDMESQESKWRTAMVQKQGNRYVTSAICNENHEWIIVTTDHTLTQERWMDEQKQELLHSLAHMETSCLTIAHMGFDQAIEELKKMSRLAVRDITIIYI